MPVYQIADAKKTELTQGSIFTLLPMSPKGYEAGDLVLFRMDGHLGVGRWFPDVGGCCWIKQPDRLICVIGQTAFKIIGIVLPITEFLQDYWN